MQKALSYLLFPKELSLPQGPLGRRGNGLCEAVPENQHKSHYEALEMTSLKPVI